MEKISNLKSADVPEEFCIFKTQLSLIEKGWLKGTYTIETFRTSNSHIFSMIRNKNVNNQIDRYSFFIDNEATFNEMDDFLAEVIKSDDLVNLAWYFKILVQSKHIDYFLQKIEEKLAKSHKQDPKRFGHHMFIAPASKPAEMSVPQGYILGPLLKSHVDTVTEQWAADTGFTTVSDDMVHIVQENIAERPSFGVFTESDPQTPIAWCSMYGGSSLAMLHVKDGHRGKGLARILLRSMLKIAQEVHGIECRLHTCVHKDNLASQKLFLSEGWEIQPVNYKKIYFFF